MIEWLKNFYFLYPARNVTTFLLQGFYCHMLSSTIIGCVIHAESHLSKVTLEREQNGNHSTVVFTFLQHHHIRRLICGCSCYCTQMTLRNYLTELTSPKSWSTFRKRLWNITWPVSGRVSLGDISRSAIKKKSLWHWYKNTNIKRKEKIYTFVHELREFSEHNAKRQPVHGVVSQACVDEVGHLLGGEDRQASFLLVKALFLYKGCINALQLVEQCRMVWQLKIK